MTERQDHRPQLIAEVGQALTSLLGREVRVAATQSAEPTEVCVRYVDGAGDVVSAWAVQRALASSLGGALTMVPRATVEEAIKTGRDDGELMANFHEVVNVLAVTAAKILSRRAVLQSVTEDGETLVRTARQIRAAGARWSTLELEIEGYPGGSLAVSLVPDDDSASSSDNAGPRQPP